MRMGMRMRMRGGSKNKNCQSNLISDPGAGIPKKNMYIRVKFACKVIT
jgi:hypothetical protein